MLERACIELSAKPTDDCTTLALENIKPRWLAGIKPAVIHAPAEPGEGVKKG